ncbi:MAG: hypothetical protein DMG05_05840 [Acidobacteria bacterium]|nr:MAG: hypothetical protein DMG05_05840 [Acidobacteriota bacterium]
MVKYHLATMKQKLTLTIEDALTEKMKIQAVLVKPSVSDITEELYKEYLDRQKKVKAKGRLKRQLAGIVSEN